MATLTRVKMYPNMNAERYLRKLPYPNDITEIPNLIPDIIIQADWDANDPDSLTRNRVSDVAMSVVGSPTLESFGATFDEQNYIDTNIDVSTYNASDMTMIAIAKPVTAGTAGMIGHLVLTGTQRYRGLVATQATWAARWLTSGIVAQTASLAVSTPDDYREIVVGRFIRDNGSGSMLTKVRTERNLAEYTQTASATPQNMPSATMKIGATAGGSGTSAITQHAVIVAGRALTDEEIATIKLIYANYYEFNNAGFKV